MTLPTDYNPGDYVRYPNEEGIREFHLGDILSITKEWVVSPRGADGVLDILAYMTNNRIWIHQVSRVGHECLPELELQNPDLEEVESPHGLQTEEEVAAWLGPVVLKYGEYRPVFKLPPDQHVSIDGIEELLSYPGAAEKMIWADVNNPQQAIEDIHRIHGGGS